MSLTLDRDFCEDQTSVQSEHVQHFLVPSSVRYDFRCELRRCRERIGGCVHHHIFVHDGLRSAMSRKDNQVSGESTSTVNTADRAAILVLRRDLHAQSWIPMLVVVL